VPELVTKFLLGHQREDEPVRDQYGYESDKSPVASQNEDEADELDNEGKNELYWHHLLEYEQTMLKRVYSDHMPQAMLGWDRKLEEGQPKNDFWNAAALLSQGACVNNVERWIDRIEAGDFCTLDEVTS
jgi:hypothetical protein